MEENEGLIRPKASFVVAVEPIIEPTPPIVAIIAVILLIDGGITGFIIKDLKTDMRPLNRIDDSDIKFESNKVIITGNFIKGIFVGSNSMLPILFRNATSLSIIPLSPEETQRIHDYLNRLYGWPSSSYRFMHSGKNKVWITSSDLKFPFRQSIPIETVGMYFGKYDMRLFRLSFDATILFRSYLKNHSIALNDEQKISWLEGKSVRAEYPASYERSFVILRWKDDVVGCGFPQSGEIRNFIPKNRRPLKKEK